MKPYTRHIFVCLGKRCSARGSEAILDNLKKRIKGGSLEGVRVTKTGCMKVCKETEVEGDYSPVVVIYPDGVWYRNVTTGDVDEMIESHIRKGEVVERLLHHKLPH
jgi:(2Fe-2S) ferredoxin